MQRPPFSILPFSSKHYVTLSMWAQYIIKTLRFEDFQFIMLFFISFFVYSASFTEIEKIFYHFFSNVPFPLSPEMFQSSLFTSTMFPCSLMDFGHVPLFPETAKRPSEILQSNYDKEAKISWDGSRQLALVKSHDEKKNYQNLRVLL